MRPVVLAVEHAAEVRAAVEGALFDRRFANDATALHDDGFGAAFEDAHHDAGRDQDSAEGQRFLQHCGSEEIDERRLFVRLLQNVEHDYEQDDPESEAQKCGRHEGNSL